MLYHRTVVTASKRREATAQPGRTRVKVMCSFADHDGLDEYCMSEMTDTNQRRQFVSLFFCYLRRSAQCRTL